MTVSTPTIHTYHCICSSLILASTHTLSSLPRRREPSLDSAIIVPLPATPPSLSDDTDEAQPLPSGGYTKTLGMSKDLKATVIRREDGFEKRMLWRCTRCRAVIGYEIQGLTEKMDIDEAEKARKYEGRVMYVLPAGAMSTDIMVGETKIREGDVDINAGTIAAFE